MRCHCDLGIENLALRQQLAVLKHRHSRPRLTDADQVFWVVLSQIWAGWRETLHVVRPGTIVRWHRQGFRYYWHWKSRRRGRPMIDPEIRHLIRRMCRANPLWGAPRIHGEEFHRQAATLEIKEVTTAARSPWQNPYAERAIGSIRRECLDHMIILGERHLKRVLSSYLAYYQGARTHLSLAKDAPDGREVQSIEKGRVVELMQVGGLHHLYKRMAA